MLSFKVLFDSAWARFNCIVLPPWVGISHVTSGSKEPIIQDEQVALIGQDY